MFIDQQRMKQDIKRRKHTKLKVVLPESPQNHLPLLLLFHWQAFFPKLASLFALPQAALKISL